MGKRLLFYLFLYLLSFIFLQFFSPFFLALLFYFMTSSFLISKLNCIKNAILKRFILLIIYIFFFALFFYILGSLFYQMILLVPKYYDLSITYFNHISVLIKAPFTRFLPYLSYLSTILQTFSTTLLKGILAFIQEIPQIISSLFLFTISLIFLIFDHHTITTYFPTKVENTLKEIIMHLSIYIRAQCLLIGTTFIIMFISLNISQFPHPLLLASITALLDALPYIGVGIILLPFCIILIFQESYLLAFYYFLIYLFINALHSLLEPLLLKDSFHLPIFLVFILTFIHLKYFGVKGIILSVIAMTLIDCMNKERKLN